MNACFRGLTIIQSHVQVHMSKNLHKHLSVSTELVRKKECLVSMMVQNRQILDAVFKMMVVGFVLP